MSTFHDGWSQLSRATSTVHENTQQAKVTWRNNEGKTFSAIVRQKPNPIGFHVRLPGDRK